MSFKETLLELKSAVLAFVGLFAALVFLGVAPLIALGILGVLFVGAILFELFKRKT